MATPRMRALQMTVALLWIAAVALAAGEEGMAAPPADWYLEHNDFLARDGGIFHADNSAYRSEDEPWDTYGLAWEKGPSGQTLRGRLFALRDGEDAGTFFEYFIFWHPAERKAFIYQVSGDGTLGVAELEPPAADGTQRTEASFSGPDGSSSRVAHVARSQGDTHSTESFDWVDGTWKPRRTYLWHRVQAQERTDARSPRS